MNTKLTKRTFKALVASSLFFALFLFSADLSAQSFSSVAQDPSATVGVSTSQVDQVLKTKLDELGATLINSTQGTAAYNNAQIRYKFYTEARLLARSVTKPSIDMEKIFEKSLYTLNLQNTSLGNAMKNEGMALVNG